MALCRELKTNPRLPRPRGPLETQGCGLEEYTSKGGNVGAITG